MSDSITSRQPTVLVVDDDELTREMISKILSGDSYRVVLAENGEQALELFPQTHPDLVLMDAMMPLMDGFEACATLRARGVVDYLPIVMVTALSDGTAMEKAFSAGATDFLTKPLNTKLLRYRVRHYVRAKLAQDELRSVLTERNLLRSLIDNLPDYIFAKDKEGRFTATNIANVRYLGASRPQDVIGKTDYDFYPPHRADAFRQDDQNLIQSGKPMLGVEVPVYDESGHIQHWYAVTKVPYRDALGEVAGIVGLIRDITEAKLAAERTHLANLKLAELNKLKNHFLLTMSHELRTPLNPIIGYADMLLTEVLGPLNNKQRDRLERIARNSRDLLTLIEDVLDLSRIQAGQLQVKQEALSLNNLLAESTPAYAQQAAEKGLTFSANLPPDLPAIQGDANALSKVLDNLLSNAVKFTQAGGVTLSLTQEASALVLCVADTGIGISQEVKSHLFDPFRQGDTSATRQQGGIGLGLALAKQLMGLMGGDVWLESTLGTGTQVYLRLPLAP
jgi:PAS domain S-box-containing protein